MLLKQRTFMMTRERSPLVLDSRDSALDPVELAVEQESPEPTGHRVVCQKLEIIVVELEGQGELPLYLMDDVEKLEERRREVGRLRVDGEIAAVAESMPEAQPLLLDQSAEALDRAVVRVQADLGYGADGRRGVPAVLQADRHRGALEIHQIDHRTGELHQALELLQPLGTLYQPGSLFSHAAM